MAYKYGFSTDYKNHISIKKGLNADIIRQISTLKKDNDFVKQMRLKSYQAFVKSKNPQWGPNLDFINFNDYVYYSSPEINSTKWDDVPKKIKDTFTKLNIPEVDAKILSGVNEQLDSQAFFHHIENELRDKHVIFCSIEEAFVKHFTLVKKYFGKLVPYTDNKYAALNTAVWSGGSFLYVPKNVKIDKPLQAYFRINTKSVGQFERTLIIIEAGAEAHYLEGCTAPIYDKNNLHAAVVEVFVHENAKFKYTTIQNWSTNVLNLVTKRAILEKGAYMEWIDGNIGSGLNMKYPTTILKGDNATAKCISIAASGKKMTMDTGAKMIHLGKNTRSNVVSKSICISGGISNYRGTINIGKNSTNSYSEVKCDTLILDNKSSSDTVPTEIIANNTSFIKHEAKISDLDREMEFYMNKNAIDKKEAQQLLSLGFIQPFTNELPLEYAIELKRLLKQII